MNTITKIAQLMMEQIPAPGMSSTMSGAAQAQSAMNVLPGQTATTGFEMDTDMGCCDDNNKFAPEHVAAARDFVAMVGSADAARELIDKVDEAMEVFDDGDDDSEAIDLVATLIPDMVDMPMQKSMTRISSMFDPSSGR
jgi:hypothetical protein